MNSGFPDWLMRKYGGEDSPEGDLARDMDRDTPDCEDSLEGYAEHLRNRGACDGALAALCRAWARYRAGYGA